MSSEESTSDNKIDRTLENVRLNTPPYSQEELQAAEIRLAERLNGHQWPQT